MKHIFIALLIMPIFCFGQWPVRQGGMGSMNYPCKLDTLKGILIWHAGDGANNGNSWDYGYWIGQCGPMGWNTPELTFVPGQWRMQYHTGGATYIEPQKGKFCDASFKRVETTRVYAFIMLHDWGTKTKSASDSTVNKLGF